MVEDLGVVVGEGSVGADLQGGEGVARPRSEEDLVEEGEDHHHSEVEGVVAEVEDTGEALEVVAEVEVEVEVEDMAGETIIHTIDRSKFITVHYEHAIAC